jgi:hypothetical protein
MIEKDFSRNAERHAAYRIQNDHCYNKMKGENENDGAYS